MSTTLGFSDMQVAIDIVIEANHVPNIVGLQGIGKSDLVRGYCKSKGYFFNEINCSLIQEGDLAMPFILERNGGKDVGYAISKIIREVSENASDTRYSILFLDEFNRASTVVQSELMNIVLQREVAGYRLHKNVRIILAMNPSSIMAGFENSNYDVSSSDAAIMGRVDTLIMKPNFKDWYAYGSQVADDGSTIIHGGILEYLKINKNEFVTKEEEGSLNNTPRGWSRASDILKKYEQMGYKFSNRLLLALLGGTLESKTAHSLFNFLKSYGNKEESVYDYIVKVLNSKNIKQYVPAFLKNSNIKQQQLMDLGLQYLSANMLDAYVYQNYIELLKVIDVNVSFKIINSISEDSSMLEDFSNFDDFIDLVGKLS